MRVLITGATGAVAPFVINELAGAHELTLFVRRRVESQHRVVLGDLQSAEDCRKAVDGVEAIIHLGANSEPAPEAMQVNVLGTYNLLEAAREVSVARFIFASTNCVYGHCYRISQRSFPLEYLPIDEIHSCYPEDNYGISKVLDERLLALYSQVWDIPCAALRLNWVWGPKEIQWRSEMENLDLATYAPYFWAYVDGRDVGRAFRLALEAPDLPHFGVYNISAADHMAEEDTLELLARYYPNVPQRSALPGRASLFDGKAASHAFGFEPHYTWRDAWMEK